MSKFYRIKKLVLLSRINLLKKFYKLSHTVNKNNKFMAYVIIMFLIHINTDIYI